MLVFTFARRAAHWSEPVLQCRTLWATIKIESHSCILQTNSGIPSPCLCFAQRGPALWPRRSSEWQAADGWRNGPAGYGALRVGQGLALWDLHHETRIHYALPYILCCWWKFTNGSMNVRFRPSGEFSQLHGFQSWEGPEDNNHDYNKHGINVIHVWHAILHSNCLLFHPQMLVWVKKIILKLSEVLLVVQGAEYSCYASDITCTYPVNGKFTKDQRVVYEGVLAARKEVIKSMRPGVRHQNQPF